MPRASDGTWSDIPNITAVPGQTIESADWNGYRADLRQNEFNAARPIVAGGTGATTPEQALTNLGGVGVSNFLDAYAVGDFYETTRTLDDNWLRRDGGIFLVADYPELAATLPALPDGVTWSNRVSGTTATIRDIIHTGTRFVAVGDTAVLSSTDGENWLLRATVAGAALYGIAYGAGIYVACDVGAGNIYTSPDGDTWTNAGVKNASGIFSVTYSGVLGLFVAVGGLTGGAAWIGTSPDGTNWTTRASGVAGVLYRVRAFGNNIVAVGGAGGAGTILTSTTATAWTVRTSGLAATLQDVAFDGSAYLVVGNGGAMASSTNLSAWTVRGSGVGNNLTVALASSAGFMAAGAAGVVRISSNLSAWTAAPTGVGGQWYGGIVDPAKPARYLLGGPSQTILDGTRTLPTQFRVPSDNPSFGWIRAVPLDD